jgi:hypothetical protein
MITVIGEYNFFIRAERKYVHLEHFWVLFFVSPLNAQNPSNKALGAF